ncbi:hypothetical protein AB9K41_08085, partial [Cribrihabitans sp. XS_ASV171]
PISALPDARKRGKMEPPDSFLQELENVHETYARAASTRRQGCAVLRKVWTAATAAGVKPRILDDLLAAEPNLPGLDPLTRKRAARLLLDLRGVGERNAA